MAVIKPATPRLAPGPGAPERSRRWRTSGLRPKPSFQRSPGKYGHIFRAIVHTLPPMVVCGKHVVTAAATPKLREADVQLQRDR